LNLHENAARTLKIFSYTERDKEQKNKPLCRSHKPQVPHNIGLSNVKLGFFANAPLISDLAVRVWLNVFFAFTFLRNMVLVQGARRGGRFLFEARAF
jgi:hypothetical protein